MKRFSLLLPLLFCLISCAGSPKSGLSPVYITNSRSIYILPPECAEDSLECLQSFSGTFGNKTFYAQTYLQSDKTGLSLVLMNSFGVQIGQLDFTQEYVKFDSAFFPKGIKAEYLIADIQNAYYSFDALKENYFNSGLTFKQLKSLHGNTTIRKLYSGSDLIETITINKKNITIKNYLRGYTYTLTGI